MFMEGMAIVHITEDIGACLLDGDHTTDTDGDTLIMVTGGDIPTTDILITATQITDTVIILIMLITEEEEIQLMLAELHIAEIIDILADDHPQVTLIAENQVLQTEQALILEVNQVVDQITAEEIRVALATHLIAEEILQEEVIRQPDLLPIILDQVLILGLVPLIEVQEAVAPEAEAIEVEVLVAAAEGVVAVN